jgi:hypothetical protein
MVGPSAQPINLRRLQPPPQPHPGPWAKTVTAAMDTKSAIPRILKCYFSFLPPTCGFLISNRMCHSIEQSLCHIVAYNHKHLKLNVKFDSDKILLRDKIRGWWIQSIQAKIEKE